MITPNGPWCFATGLRIATHAAMQDLGRELAGLLRAGDLVILAGPLGAGKTTLVQGIGEGLQVRGPVTSPTFVIARVHPPLSGSGPSLVHADAYRLGSIAEVDDLDLDADVASAVTVVEWGEGLAERLAEDRLEISIQPDADGGVRTVRLTGHGARWSAVLACQGAGEGLSGKAVSEQDGSFIVPLYFDPRFAYRAVTYRIPFPEACRARAGIPASSPAGRALWP
jgi:tRNA threonylcarbamoyladenosine biosynthesis protein TsaE